MRGVWGAAAVALVAVLAACSPSAKSDGAVAEGVSAKTAAPDKCLGFDPSLSPEDNAKRAVAELHGLPAETVAEREHEIAATLKALPVYAPIYPCATALSADSPEDGSGVIKFSFTVSGTAEPVVAFYKERFAGHGAVDFIEEQQGESTARTVTIASQDGARNTGVHVLEAPSEEGSPASVQVFLEDEKS